MFDHLLLLFAGMFVGGLGIASFGVYSGIKNSNSPRFGVMLIGILNVWVAVTGAITLIVLRAFNYVQ